MSNYTDWLSSTDLGADVVGDPSGASDPTTNFPEDGTNGQGSNSLGRRDRTPMWRRSPSSWLQEDWSLPPRTQPLSGGRTTDRRRTIIDDLGSRGMASMPDVEDDTDEDEDEDEDMETDLDREHAEATQWLHRTLAGQLTGLPRTVAGVRAAATRRAHQAAITAIRSGSNESGRRITSNDIETGTYEDIIDAERMGDDWGPSSSFTVPTNAGMNASLHGFTPAVVGSGAASANDSPSVIPVPTMPTSSRFKRRRTATTGDSRLQSTSRRLGTLNTRSEPAPELTTDQMPKYMHVSRTAVVALPTELNAYDMCQRLALSTHDGQALQVEFIGDGKGGDADAAAVRADNPIPKGCGVFYFEAEVICQGKHGYIAIGLCTRSVRLDRLTGWEPGSFAWHLDDGFVFKSQGQGTNLGWPKSGTGDTIGCGVEVDGTVFFTRNGSFVGDAFKMQDVENDELYPAIGLRSPGEHLSLNFGLSSQSFKYDIEGHVARTQALVLSEIARTPVYITRPTSLTSAEGNVTTPLSEDTGPSAKKSKGQDGTPVARSEKPEATEELNSDHLTTSKCWEGFEKEERERKVQEQEGERKDGGKMRPLVPTRDRRIVEDVETPLADVVLDYLQQSGFLNTAKALRPAIAARRENVLVGIVDKPKIRPTNTDEEDAFAERMKAIRKAMMEWDVPSLLDLGVLELEGTHWTFTLRIMVFHHLVNMLWADQPITEKWRQALAWLDIGLPKTEAQGHDLVVEVGTSLQRLYGDMEDAKVQKVLSNTFSLVTYGTAEEVPVHLSRASSVEERGHLADQLVRDLRLHARRPAESRLEQALRQTSHTMGSLGSVFGVNAAAYAGMDV